MTTRLYGLRDLHAIAGAYVLPVLLAIAATGLCWTRLALSNALYAIHIGSIAGLPGRIAALSAAVVLAGLCVTGPWMWLKRRPRGKLGVPPRARRTPWPLFALWAIAGWLMPMLGYSLLGVLAIELVAWLVRRRRDRLGGLIALTVLALTSLAGRPARAEPAPADPASPAAGLSDAELLESAQGEVISVESKREGQTLRESARAVTVIETKVARKRAADLGEVLSRVQGVQVRRDGGLGSTARFALNGLYDDQVRFFIDGVPLELAGWGIGIANVPVDLLERVDIYRGVVPIALGTDALGGAVDLITDPSWVSRASANLEHGSFGTDRGSLSAVARDPGTGVALRLSAFTDRARNDYPIDVEIPDEQGRLHDARVRRFHDGYLAAGGNVQLGIVDRGAVRRALVRLLATKYDKDLQNNLVMSIPYGEVSYGEEARGATGELVLAPGAWQLRALAGATRRRIAFHDVSPQVYDWLGNAIRDRTILGEIDTDPTDQILTERSAFARLVGERALGHHHLRIAIAPTSTRRSGQDLLGPDVVHSPLLAPRDLRTVVSGLEHEWRSPGDVLQHVGFIKHYAMWTRADDPQTGGGVVAIHDRIQRFGVGEALRWRARPWLALKASYEYATRLPSVDELFGDGKLVGDNPDLEPEVSHNANLEVAIARDGRYGELTATADVFVRDTDNLILPLGDDRRIVNQNVYRARTLGIEGGGAWRAPGGRGWVDGSITVQDQRNVSSSGSFADYDGDHLPNRPLLLAALGATARFADLLHRGDELLAFASSRYVRSFYRGWESLGRRDTKQIIPSQLVHTLGVTYVLHADHAYAATLECQNLTDTAARDSWGVVRPGRGFYLKLGVEL